MTIGKRGEVWWVDVTVRTERVRESLRTADKKEALKRAHDIENALFSSTLIRVEGLNPQSRSRMLKPLPN